MIAVWVVLGLIVLLVLTGILMYNRLVRARVRVDNGWSQIDVQLKRRYDLIPNLIETVKGYAAHEREVFEAVTNARAQAQNASGVQGQAEAENQLTQSIRQLFAVAENYPELKASQNFLALQEELTGTESRIAFARQFYNDQVANLNVLIGTFPSSILAKLGHFTPREFFEIDDPAKGPVQVQF
jgi:LemA protein